MKIFATRPWYAAGLAFECVRCGRCCAGPAPGYVWITLEELAALAEFLSLSVEEARRRYVREVRQRLSLLEDPKTKDCVFLRYDAEGNSFCAIYPVRPLQCQTWPFWPMNLISPASWALAGARCPGINRGQRHEFDEIEDKRKRVDP